VATGTWTWPPVEEQIVRFAETVGRYVQLTAVTERQGRAWTSAAEIGVYASPVPTEPQPPELGAVTCEHRMLDAKTLLITCTMP
jgi:hypothetical protein